MSNPVKPVWRRMTHVGRDPRQNEETPTTTAREIMTPDCRCVRSTDTVVDAARMTAELRVGVLPIVGEDSRLHGILTTEISL
ncbi:CBS domain-containing protein [Nocardia sp. NPDC046763]|uniref:CBS domain-containing protein n=1 Tax=Nocardia sp. NPDC046763 TaxID=3155256 RepID=UPI0034056FD0